MACNLDVITCNYMHYMSLHATEDANVVTAAKYDRCSASDLRRYKKEIRIVPLI